MTADCLLDTNILVYAVDTAPNNRSKRAIAIELIRQKDFGLSAQVLQEFYVTVTRKFTKPLAPKKTLAFLDNFQAFPTVPTDRSLITLGIRNSIKYQVSYWDGAILAAAERLKVSILYSEDLNHLQRYGTVQVINPFV